MLTTSDAIARPLVCCVGWAGAVRRRRRAVRSVRRRRSAGAAAAAGSEARARAPAPTAAAVCSSAPSSWRAFCQFGTPQVSRMAATATRPTTTITARSTTGDSRRPTDAPRKPPTTAPSPRTRTISQSISASMPNRPNSTTSDEDQAGHGVDGGRQDVLRAVEALQGLVDPDAEHCHQQHALGGSEVAPVDAGHEHRRPHPPGTVPSGLGAGCLAGLRPGRHHLGQPRLQDHQHHAEQDQRGDDRPRTRPAGAPGAAPRRSGRRRPTRRAAG